MNHTAFFASLKKKEIAGCYLFEGSEEYIKEQALRRLKENLLPEGLEMLNLTELENPAADDLIAACETFPMMADRRLVVVRELSMLSPLKKSEDDRETSKVTEYLDHFPQTSCLVFYQKGKADARKKLVTKLKKMDAVVSFEPMNDMECCGWVEKTLKQKGVPISRKCAELMVFTVGTDASLLTQEMEKLVSWLDGRREITEEDIRTICTASVECTVFQMIDAQVAGNTEKALELIGELVRNGEERMGMMALLLRQYRILYHMKCLMDEGVPEAKLGPLLGIAPYMIGRTQQQAKHFSREQLKKAYDWLMEQEYRIKQGLTGQEGCAENAIFQLNAILGKVKS